jgi:hypothetical protein
MAPSAMADGAMPGAAACPRLRVTLETQAPWGPVARRTGALLSEDVRTDYLP